jgi:Uncharacterised nucleotidyltransferase
MRVLDRETVNLLRAVVMLGAQSNVATIPYLLSKITCWEVTIEGARQHGILPTLYSALKSNESLIPPHALERLRSEFESNAFHCMTNAAELLEVLKAFEKAEIAAMPFKGIVLGASVYGDMMARGAGDLDLLIYHRDLPLATQILKERGYEQMTRVLEDGKPESEDYFEYHFERAADGMILELRWRLELTQPRFRFDLGMDWVWPKRSTVRLAGVDVPTLDPISNLLTLCMHGSKHVWSRLIWICDVAKLLESEPGLDWDSVQQEAKRVGLWRCLALGVLLARRVSGAQTPASVVQSFEADRWAPNLAEFLDEHLLAEPGKVPDGRIPYNIQILAFRDRAGAVLSPAFLRPNEHDRAVVNLPKALESLYYLIRPFRVLLDRTSR